MLIHGNRGGGKTTVLLMDYLKDVGKGFGPYWKGLILRQTYPQLQDIINASLIWFPQIYPKAKFNKQKNEWTFPDGERLRFGHAMRTEDYLNFHGYNLTWLGWEELTNWASSELYETMISTIRSPSIPGMVCRIRATTNPSGPGHNWVKNKFINKAPQGEIFFNDQDQSLAHIKVDLLDNIYLINDDDIEYLKTMMAIPDPILRKAWLNGSWEITSGGMFDDVWDSRYNIVNPFTIPSDWEVDRCFDWGSTKPHATLWVAESSGSSYIDYRGRSVDTVKGDLFVIREHYGWTGKRNEGSRDLASKIATTIRSIDQDIARKNPGIKVIPGPADSSIYNSENGNCIADDMRAEKVDWVPANKGPNTRVLGWDKMRSLIYYARPEIEEEVIDHENGGIVKRKLPNDQAGLYFFNNCEQSIETIPNLPRDVKKTDDVDTDSEDHLADALRYRLLSKMPKMDRQGVIGW